MFTFFLFFSSCHFHANDEIVLISSCEQTRLQMHEDLIRENLGIKLDIRQHLELLKFISYMTPFLVGMRKRMKIPDVTRLLPPLTGKLLLPSIHWFSAFCPQT